MHQLHGRQAMALLHPLAAAAIPTQQLRGQLEDTYDQKSSSTGNTSSESGHCVERAQLKLPHVTYSGNYAKHTLHLRSS